MPMMKSSKTKFQKLRKEVLSNICQIICGKFHQNLFIRFCCRDDTHTRAQAGRYQTGRQADRQTDRQTGRQTDRQTDRPGAWQADPTPGRRQQLWSGCGEAPWQPVIGTGQSPATI